MSGKIKLSIRYVYCKITGRKDYPAWIIEVTGEDGTTVILQPTWKETFGFVKAALTHEKKVDEIDFVLDDGSIKRRNPDAPKYLEYTADLLDFIDKQKILDGYIK